ncbi:hypothetical protein FQN57_005363 [Myotisia sp. PD_48]|nr:hypothetical protein FQN57_005363 [Myotisia sp. PD_48]
MDSQPTRFQMLLNKKIEDRRRQLDTTSLIDHPSEHSETIFTLPSPAGSNSELIIQPSVLPPQITNTIHPQDNPQHPPQHPQATLQGPIMHHHQDTSQQAPILQQPQDTSQQGPIIQQPQSPIFSPPTNPAAHQTTDMDTSISLNSMEDQPAKRAKISPPALTLQCRCSIGQDCERAAAIGVQDCRSSSQNNLTPRRIPKKPRGMQHSEYISKKRQMEIRRSSEDVLEILSSFVKFQTAHSPADRERAINRMRDRIQYFRHYEIPPSSLALIKRKFLDVITGFPGIINAQSIPWDIRLDAEVMYRRLMNDDLDPDLMRGILIKRNIKDGVMKGVSRSLDPNYPFKRSVFRGQGPLCNGHWYPYQICAVRDGAHGEMEAGISGREGWGAVSILLSAGRSPGVSYADIDQGDTIKYCGTSGKNLRISSGTQLLLESAGLKNEIRVFRSSKLPKVNPYRPSAGIRYDGLYKITSHELLDEESRMYRFTLERELGQPPIRYNGPGKRPTTREEEELRSLQALLAG